MSQGRVVYLGYRSSYTTPLQLELDYLDTSNNPQTFTVAGFSPNPGSVFSISNFGSALAVRLKNQISGNVLAKKLGFPDSCTDGCWPCNQMIDDTAQPVGYWVSWDPTSNVVVIMDEEVVITPGP